MYLPVKADEFNDSITVAVKCEAVMEFSPDPDMAPKQKRDKKTGFPVWSVECAYSHDEDYGTELVSVRLVSASDPTISAGPIRFGGLAFRTWDMNGKKGLSITAQSFTQETARPKKAKASAQKVSA